MAKLQELRKLVQTTIENGANTVEAVHKQIANMPLDALMKIGPIEAKVKTVKDFQEHTIGSMYETIRNITSKAGEIAEEILNKVEPPAKPKAKK